MSEDPTVRALFERFPCGVFILSLPGPGESLMGIVATWVMQVAFEPPLVAVSVEREGALAEALQRAGRFSLNLVRSDDISTAKGVLKHGPDLAGSEIGEAFRLTGEGLPVLRNGAGHLACQTTQIHEAGDHLLVVAEVVRGESPGPSEILTLRETGWKYRKKNSTKSAD